MSIHSDINTCTPITSLYQILAWTACWPRNMRMSACLGCEYSGWVTKTTGLRFRGRGMKQQPGAAGWSLTCWLPLWCGVLFQLPVPGVCFLAFPGGPWLSELEVWEMDMNSCLSSLSPFTSLFPSWLPALQTSRFSTGWRQRAYGDCWTRSHKCIPVIHTGTHMTMYYMAT